MKHEEHYNMSRKRNKKKGKLCLWLGWIDRECRLSDGKRRHTFVPEQPGQKISGHLFRIMGLSRLEMSMKGVKEVMDYDDVGSDVYVLTMTRLVCFPARLRSAYGIGLLQDSSGSYSSVYSGLEFGGVVESSGGVRRPDVVWWTGGWRLDGSWLDVGVCEERGGNIGDGLTGTDTLGAGLVGGWG